ncbi:MAG: 2-oxoisovalerate dehydrogenase [Gammaproteobacteria bacterium]|nr:2-oxoisovalerate dehydrogenase [Gammaproteobacteria bacterium]
MRESPTTSEIIFEVAEALEGGYNARALGHSVFTQGDNWNDLKEMVRDAVLCHFEEKDVPSVIRLHLVRDESLVV